MLKVACLCKPLLLVIVILYIKLFHSPSISQTRYTLDNLIMSSNADIIAPSVGDLVLDSLRRHQDRVCQIDAATGEEETYGSVLKRSIQLARALRTSGLSPGDVLAVSGPNHLDLCIPSYAALYNGLPMIGVDPYFKYDEVRTLFKLTRPKIAFCQNASYDIYAKAAADLDLELKLVTFDKGDCTMEKFIQMYDKNEPEDDFKVAEFDLEEIYAMLVCTSGSSGKVKVAAFKHRSLLLKETWLMKIITMANALNKKTLVLSPVNWISNYFTTIHGLAAGETRIQTSKPDNYDHYIDIINKYRPQTCLLSPTLMAYMISRKEKVDLSCFQSVATAGSKVYPEVYAELKKMLNSNCIVVEGYGQTENLGHILSMNPFGPIGNCGKPTDLYSIKLVDPVTGAEINEANVTGELFVKGPGFSEYYNDPEETAQAFTEDGYFKTGDLLYHDSDGYYFFVDRIKSLIKYRNSHVLPAELEEVIMGHAGVKQVCVVGVDDPVDGQRPVACVVRHEGSDVSAQEIKDLVASKLSKNKELRGGVVFLDSLPYTSAGKVARGKIRELVTRVEKE